MAKTPERASRGLEDIVYDPQKPAESLRAIYDQTVTDIRRQISWYTENSRKKKRLAQSTRWFALITLGLGSVLPVVFDVLRTLGVAEIPGTFASLVLAAGTGALVLDRQMGFSSGWMRFISTELFLKSRLSAFNYEILIEKVRGAQSNGNEITPEQAESFIRQCANFRAEIWTITNDETRLWMEEFQSSLRSLDDKYRDIVAQIQPGGVQLTVTNGERYPEGWDLWIESRRVGHYTGKSAAVNNLAIGTHKVTVQVTDKPETRTEKLVTISSGQVCEVTIELPDTPVG